MAAIFPPNPLDVPPVPDDAEAREKRGEPSSVFGAWNRLNRTLVRDLPAGLDRAEQARRRIARRR